MIMKQSQVDHYLDIAQEACHKSTCLRANYGAVIVKDGEIISIGYNDAPTGRQSCTELNYCRRKQLNIPRGERYEMCRSVHAEVNAILSASKEMLEDASLFLVGINPETGDLIENADCCSICKRIIINSGIKEVFIRTKKPEVQKPIVLYVSVKQWITNDETLTDHRGY